MTIELGDGVVAMVPVDRFAVALHGEVIATTAKTMTVRWNLPVGEPIEEVVHGPVKVLRSEHWGLVDRDTGMPKRIT